MGFFNLSPREQYDLFVDWGFTDGGPVAGGHVKMLSPNGGHVQITAPGRPKTARAHGVSIKKGAKAMGVSVQKFLQGPPKPITSPGIAALLPTVRGDPDWFEAPTAETSTTGPSGVEWSTLTLPPSQQPTETEPRKEQDMAEQPRNPRGAHRVGKPPEHNGKWDLYWRALKNITRPGDVFDIEDTAKRAGLGNTREEARSFGAFLAQMAKQGRIERVSRGKYRRPDPAAPPPAPAPPADQTTEEKVLARLQAEQDSAVALQQEVREALTSKPADILEVVHTLSGGRMLLEDANGVLWVGRLSKVPLD